MRKTQHRSPLIDMLERALAEQVVQERLTGPARTRVALLAHWDAYGQSVRWQAEMFRVLTKGTATAPEGITIAHTTIWSWQETRRAADTHALQAASA